MSAPSAPPPRLTYQVPSLGWRITVAALRLIPLMLLFVGLPVAALAFLQSNSIALPLSIVAVTLAGAIIVALSTARYIAKPTSAFGPLSIASSAFVLAYLYYIVLRSTYVLAVPGSDFTVRLTYTNFMLCLMVVPALSLAAGIVTTIEDARVPRERLPYDYPP
ncbi:MAG: hypothetical protein L3J92_07180 [Thermoplasmata archaeon]|nr:hypothetical protein [Thermoplasmata archaeon]